MLFNIIIIILYLVKLMAVFISSGGIRSVSSVSDVLACVNHENYYLHEESNEINSFSPLLRRLL